MQPPPLLPHALPASSGAAAFIPSLLRPPPYAQLLLPAAGDVPITNDPVIAEIDESTATAAAVTSAVVMMAAAVPWTLLCSDAVGGMHAEGC